MLRDRLQTHDFVLCGTKSECEDVVENTRHMTTLSNPAPKTIQFTDAPQLLFQEQGSHGSYFSRNFFASRGPRQLLKK